jgi:probable F420-dependent oxidoreductase
VPPARPFRFGVAVNNAPTRRSWRQLVRKIESLGASSVCVSDHFNDQLAPLPALAAAAEATTTLRLATHVLCNDFKHPVVHAKELATIDVLSAGRLEWGMGAGWFDPDYRTSGMAMDPPAVRVSRLIEAVGIIDGLFGPDEVTNHGAFYAVDGLVGTPRPVQAPRPPSMIGGARRRILSFAAREADIVGIAPDPESRTLLGRPPLLSVAAALDRQQSWIQAAAVARPEPPELQVVTMPLVTDDVEGRVQQIAPSMGLEPDEVRASPYALVGSVDQMCEELERHRARWGLSYWVIPGASLDGFAPVIDRMTGR